MGKLSLGTTDPIQLSEIFSGCGRAYPFYGIPLDESPESPFFSHVFQKAMVNGIHLARNSATILEQLLTRQNHRGHAGGFMKQAGELNFSTKTIAFLGNSRVGKSSVISSLLDFPDIASNERTSNYLVNFWYLSKEIGEHELRLDHGRYRIQTNGFRPSPVHLIEVEYLSQVASKDHIKEILWSFRQSIILPDVSEDRSIGRDWLHEREGVQTGLAHFKCSVWMRGRI